MRLHRLKLNNYRSFGPDTQTITFEDLTVLIGGNSSGKTAVMQALAKLFSPAPKDRVLQRSDFHLAKGERPEDMPEKTLSIEAVFSFPELESDDDPQAERTIPTVFNQMAVAGEDKKLYLRIRLTATWSPSDNNPDGEIESKLEFIRVAESIEDKEKNRQELRQQERSHIQLIYVPAVRDPLAQLRHQSGAMLWRLLNAIKWSDSLKEKLRTGAQDINNLFDDESGFKNVRGIIQDQWTLFHEDERYRDIAVGFSSEDLTEVLKRVELRFKPTVEEKAYSVDQLGDGMRSMFYLSLVSSVLQVEQKLQTRRAAEGAGFTRENYTPPALTILAIEEPENHLSPQLLGRVVENLTQTGLQPNADVILSTHTPAILHRVAPEQIRHLRIDENRQVTMASSISLPTDKGEEYKFVKEAVMAFPELYFARLVILGEGDSEEIVIPRLLEALKYSLDRSQVSMVPLGGRHVNHFWRLLTDLKIPHITLLDLDRERLGGGWGRIKYALEQLIKNGVDSNTLFSMNHREVADLDAMGAWDDTSVKEMNTWILMLRKYNVFYSYPLDLDFTMLTAFPDQYKATAGTRPGPRIPDKKKQPTEYKQQLEGAIRVVLKEEGGTGATFSLYDQDLFFWYRYLFLGRGKPITHMSALSNLGNEELLKRIPKSLRSMCDRVDLLLRKGKPDAQKR